MNFNKSYINKNNIKDWQTHLFVKILFLDKNNNFTLKNSF